MRVAMIQCPVWTVDTPPLGPALVAAAAKRDGHIVTGFDLNIELYRRVETGHARLWDQGESFIWTERDRVESLFKQWQDFLESFVDGVLASESEVYGFSINRASLQSSRIVSGLIKKKRASAIIVWGGPSTLTESELSEALEHETVDYVVVGEGESTFPQLLQALAQGGLDSVSGICRRTKSGWLRSKPALPIADLDQIPIPSFDIFPVEKYRDRCFPITMGRGCRGRCAFCCDRKIWGAYRMRSAQVVVDEFRELQARFGISSFEITDSMINADSEEFVKMVDFLNEQAIRITWKGNIKPVRTLSDEVLVKMKKSGCCSMTMGVESGSPRVVNDMRKGFVLSDVQRILKKAHELGIETYLNFMVGFPTEGWLDFLRTMVFIVKNRKWIDNIVSISHCGIVSQSELALQPERFGLTYERDVHGNIAQKYWLGRKGHNHFAARLKRLEILTGLVGRLRMNPSYVQKSFDENELELTRYYFDTGKYKKALRVARRLHAKNRKIATLPMLLARIHLALGQPEKAALLLKDTCLEDPSTENLYWLGEALRLGDHIQEAAEVFERYADSDAKQGQTFHRQAEAFYAAERWLEAAQTAQKALASDSENQGLRTFIGDCLWRAARKARSEGRIDAAIKLLDHALKLGVAGAGMIKELGECYLQLGAIKQAKGFLAQAIRLNPEENWTWFSLGECLLRERRVKAAETCYHRCLALAPTNESALSRLAELRPSGESAPDHQ